ncbi:hypothetical protein PRIPAC_75372 [Pristionchus pacificus]|uniref:Uncharacterized protein n=1 Tax=Pristionchus pacificus TaxID=54126 RepID=A0A2A6CAY2_PRIPA|nr:hypothetical protein PRIPAC_75372 [Pristionchus pacificus]|eukprot:PDM75181.1 hypothetical protein PRIPAC_40562 [Pristionchus pacificus]
MTFAATALISGKCFPLHNIRECAVIRAKSYPQMDELHKCVICEEGFNPSLTACHIIDSHLHTTIFNCKLCNFKTIFERLLVIHSQASHGCALSMTIIGSSIDFSDDSLFLAKELTLVAKQDGCSDALNQILEEEEACNVSDALIRFAQSAWEKRVSCFEKTVYDIALHVKTHVAEGEWQIRFL